RGASPFAQPEVVVAETKSKKELYRKKGEGFAAFSPDGRSLALHSSSVGKVRAILIDPRAATRQQTLEASTKSLALSLRSLHAKSLVATAKALTGAGSSDEALFSPDGRLFGVTGESGFVVWEMLTGEVVATGQMPKGFRPHSTVVAPSGRVLVAG